MHAHEEARHLNRRSIGAEWILLGLVKDNDNVAAEVLSSFDVEFLALRAEVEKFNPNCASGRSGEIRFNASAKRVVQKAEEVSSKNGVDYINTKHLLLGILQEQEKDSAVSSVLKAFDVDIKAACDMLTAQDGESDALYTARPEPNFITPDFSVYTQNPGAIEKLEEIFEATIWACLLVFLVACLYFLLIRI